MCNTYCVLCNCSGRTGGFLKAQKCTFSLETIDFVRFWVSIAGVEPDVAKRKASQRWHLPLYARTDCSDQRSQLTRPAPDLRLLPEFLA